MRQVLLAPVHDRRASRPVLLWMDDSTRIGDAFKWQGAYWIVSAVYGTRFSESGGVARRDKPPRSEEAAAGPPAPAER